MSIIQLVMAIAADLRAKDYPKLLTDFIDLIRLLASANVPTPAPQILAMGMPVSWPDTNPDALAVELEKFASGHHADAGMKSAPAEKINWQGLVALLVKLLPLIIGGL